MYLHREAANIGPHNSVGRVPNNTERTTKNILSVRNIKDVEIIAQ